MKKEGLKISELSKMTGVAKSTILFYVKKGLLPEPVKTSPNMAWYSEECVDKINFIKEMQNRKFVPLDHIKRMMEAIDQDNLHPEMLLNLNKVLFEDKSPDDPVYTRKEFLKETGLNEEYLQKLEKLNLIIPTEDDGEQVYGLEDVQTASGLSKMKKFGITPEDLEYYPRLIAEIVDEDMNLHHSKFGDKHDHADAEFIEITETMVEIGRFAREYYFRKLFPLRVIKRVEEETLSCLEQENNDENKNE
jgi:DNA-binding transcriptional MerR regulator